MQHDSGRVESGHQCPCSVSVISQTAPCCVSMPVTCILGGCQCTVSYTLRPGQHAAGWTKHMERHGPHLVFDGSIAESSEAVEAVVHAAMPKKPAPDS